MLPKLTHESRHFSLISNYSTKNKERNYRTAYKNKDRNRYGLREKERQKGEKEDFICYT